MFKNRVVYAPSTMAEPAMRVVKFSSRSRASPFARSVLRRIVNLSLFLSRFGRALFSTGPRDTLSAEIHKDSRRYRVSYHASPSVSR